MNTIMETMTTLIHKFEAAGLGVGPFKVVGFEIMKFQACQGAPVQPGTSCDYCGTGIMNVYFIQSADGRKFKVGSDCVAKTGDAGLKKTVREYQKTAREQAKELVRERARQQGAAKSIEFLAAHPGLAEALAFGHRISIDLAAQLQSRGTLSDKQVALAFKLPADVAAKAKAEADRKASGIKLVAGRREIVGTVISTKLVDSFYGSTLKMLVQEDNGCRVFGTVPVMKNDEGKLDGKRVKFHAEVEVARNDEMFGFFRRPTKGEVIS